MQQAMQLMNKTSVQVLHRVTFSRLESNVGDLRRLEILVRFEQRATRTKLTRHCTKQLAIRVFGGANRSVEPSVQFYRRVTPPSDLLLRVPNIGVQLMCHQSQ